jgi:hypothetical protein
MEKVGEENKVRDASYATASPFSITRWLATPTTCKFLSLAPSASSSAGGLASAYGVVDDKCPPV